MAPLSAAPKSIVSTPARPKPLSSSPAAVRPYSLTLAVAPLAAGVLTAMTVRPVGVTTMSLTTVPLGTSSVSVPPLPKAVSGLLSGVRRVSLTLSSTLPSSSCPPQLSSAVATKVPTSVGSKLRVPVRLTSKLGSVLCGSTRTEACATVVPKAVLLRVSTPLCPLLKPPSRSQALKLTALARVPVVPVGWKYSRVLASAMSTLAVLASTLPSSSQLAPPSVLNHNAPLPTPVTAMPAASPSASVKALPSSSATSWLPSVLPLMGAWAVSGTVGSVKLAPSASTGGVLARSVTLAVSISVEKLARLRTTRRPPLVPSATSISASSGATPAPEPGVSSLPSSTGVRREDTSNTLTPLPPSAT